MFILFDSSLVLTAVCRASLFSFSKVKVKWNKDTYDLELDTTEPPNVFKAQIFGLTGVSPERQKVMFKGAVIKDDEWNPATLKVIKNVSWSARCKQHFINFYISGCHFPHDRFLRRAA